MAPSSEWRDLSMPGFDSREVGNYTVYAYRLGVFSLTGRYRFSIAAGTAAAASGTVTDLPVVIRVTSLGHLEIGL